MSLHSFLQPPLLRIACVLLFPVCMCGCATKPIGPLPGCTPQIMTRMYFGLHSPQGEVSEPQWKSFLADQITPLFPSGLTVLSGNGQWRSAQGTVVPEESRIVEIVHQNEAGVAGKIKAITQLYKSSFSQESVLVLQQPVIACF